MRLKLVVVLLEGILVLLEVPRAAWHNANEHRVKEMVHVPQWCGCFNSPANVF